MPMSPDSLPDPSKTNTLLVDPPSLLLPFFLLKLDEVLVQGLDVELLLHIILLDDLSNLLHLLV